jgi:hypothetical protein
MTFVIARANADQFIQVSDRRLFAFPSAWAPQGSNVRFEAHCGLKWDISPVREVPRPLLAG